MFKKLSKYVAEKCDPKTLHPICDLKDVERFKPLCVVEKKKHLGFWKKSSMNSTLLTLNDLLLTRDVRVVKTENTLQTESEEEKTIKVGASIGNKIASEHDFEYVTGDKLNLVFNLGILERNEVSYEELLQALEDNPLDESHPLYLNAKSTKNQLCLVIETLSTKDDGTLPNEQVLSLVSGSEMTTCSTVTVDIHAKGSAEKKSSYTYVVSPGTVLAYKCVEFNMESNGTIILQRIPDNLDDSKDTPEQPTPQPELTEVNEMDGTDVKDTDGMKTDVVDTDVKPIEDIPTDSIINEVTDEDLEVPIIIRDVNQDDPITQIKIEFEPLLQLGCFSKLQGEIRTLITNASENDFQLIYLLLYRANLFMANNSGDKFMTLANVEKLIGDETKRFTWKTAMTRIGFSVPKDVNETNACVTFPKKDDRGVIQAFMGVIGCVTNINVPARKLMINIAVDHVKIIFNIIELQLQNISTFINDPIIEGMILKDPLTLELLLMCGFKKSTEDENMLTFSSENLYMLLDVYALLHVLYAGKKPFLKSTPSFSKDKKKSTLIPRRMSSFRRPKQDKLAESQTNLDQSNEDKASQTNDEKITQLNEEKVSQPNEDNSTETHPKTEE